MVEKLFDLDFNLKRKIMEISLFSLMAIKI